MSIVSKIIAIIVFLIPLSVLATWPAITTKGDSQVNGNMTVYGEIYRHILQRTESITGETREDVTFYVDSAGSDTNNCLTASTPCATIQEALDRIPKIIKHNITVSIGSGNFAGFSVNFFRIKRYAKLLIQGTLGQPTLTTGTPTGTATGGSTTQLIDAGQNWTVNELRGMLLYVNSEYRVIQDNDATTINVIGVYSATCNGKAYEILEQKTNVNSGYGDTSTSRMDFHSNIFRSNNLEMSDIAIDATGRNAGIYALYNPMGLPALYRIKTTSGANSGIFYADGLGELRMSEIYVYNSGQAGLRMQRIFGSDTFSSSNFTNFYIYGGASQAAYDLLRVKGYVTTGYMVIDNTTGIGVQINVADAVELDNIEILSCTVGISGNIVTKLDLDGTTTIQNCSGNGIDIENTDYFDMDSGTISTTGGYGIYIDENTAGSRRARTHANIAACTISNNTSGGVIAKNNSIITLNNVGGAGNGNYGLELEVGSYGIVTTNTSITGASGNATINDGATTLTWATDFATNLDVVVNTSNQCLIERRD